MQLRSRGEPTELKISHGAVAIRWTPVRNVELLVKVKERGAKILGVDAGAC